MMKIPYNKDVKSLNIGFAVIVLLYYLVSVICTGKFWWDDPLLTAFFIGMILFVAFLFIVTYRWSEIDETGITVHNFVGRVNTYKWEEFAYVGSVLTSNFNKTGTVLIIACSRRLPYKSKSRHDCWTLGDALGFAYSEELCEGFYKYCPSFSTLYETP